MLLNNFETLIEAFLLPEKENLLEEQLLINWHYLHLSRKYFAQMKQ
jgi:hypothetical protein